MVSSLISPCTVILITGENITDELEELSLAPCSDETPLYSAKAEVSGGSKSPTTGVTLYETSLIFGAFISVMSGWVLNFQYLW